MEYSNNPYFLDIGGANGSVLRERNWSGTSLGPPNKWSRDFCSMLTTVLESGFPMALLWGEEFLIFYNDAYRNALGSEGKHPQAFGERAQDVWSEIWDEVSPMLSDVMDNGKTLYYKDKPFKISRNGDYENTYWTFSYSPIRAGDASIAGVLVICNETTDILGANERLKESEMRFRTMAEGTAIMILVGDEKGNSTYFNDAWSKFTGKPKEELLEKGWSALIHPDEREMLTANFLTNLRKERKWESEYRLRSANGEYRWVSFYVSPQFQCDGSFTGFVASVIDTHEPKMLEQEAMRYKFMAEKATDPFILMCEDGSFDYLNPAALDKWGYTREEAKVLTVPDVDAVYDLKSFEALFSLSLKREVPHFETLHRSKNGNTFPVEVQVSGFNYQGKSHMLGISRDISERKKAEEDLRESELRFRKLADQSPMWIWMTDANVNVEYANPALLDYIGITKASDFKGHIWVEIVHSDDIDIVYEGFGDAVEHQKEFSLDYRVRRASTGLYEWFTVKGVPRFEGEKLLGFIGTGMNVHREKTFSEQLRKEVRIRTSELAKSNLELEKSNKELQSFAYISSHDLQEPLRKIQTFTSLLLATEFNQLSDKGKDRFKRMEFAAKRMQALINDLLAYSRFDMETRKFEDVELESILNEVKTDLADEIRRKKAQVILESSCQLKVVRFQIRQLLYNLISNSLKYSKEEEAPIIKIKSELVNRASIPEHVELPDGKYVFIRISDNGIGFESAYAEKIFEVFQRLHGREKYWGTGVGLAIVRKIAENHKGIVSASGEPGKGAIIKLYLPVRRNSN